MADEDRAQEIELMEWERNNKPRNAPFKFDRTDPRYGPEACADCDEDMPLARREYGFCLCVECKTKAERVAH